MEIIQAIRCPNCGSIAKRTRFVNSNSIETNCPEDRITRTECPACDYLMVTCSLNGRVLEAYAPGIMATCGDRSWEHLQDPSQFFDVIPVRSAPEIETTRR